MTNKTVGDLLAKIEKYYMIKGEHIFHYSQTITRKSQKVCPNFRTGLKENTNDGVDPSQVKRIFWHFVPYWVTRLPLY